MNKLNKLLIAIVSTASMMMSSNVFAVGLCVGNHGADVSSSDSYILDNPGDSFTCQLRGNLFGRSDAVGTVRFGLPGDEDNNDPNRFYSTNYQCTLDFKDWNPKKNMKLNYSYSLGKYDPFKYPLVTIMGNPTIEIPTWSVKIPTMKVTINFNSGPNGDCYGDSNCYFFNNIPGSQINISEIPKDKGEYKFSPLTVSCKLLKKTPLFQKMNPDFPQSS